MTFICQQALPFTYFAALFTSSSSTFVGAGARRVSRAEEKIWRTRPSSSARASQQDYDRSGNFLELENSTRNLPRVRVLRQNHTAAGNSS